MSILVFLVVLLAVVVIFSVQNASPVAVTFLVWKFDASLAIVIFLSLITGILIGSIITLWARRRRAPVRQVPPDEPHAPHDPSNTREF